MIMSSNLIFHVVSKRKWRELSRGGVYKPENLEQNSGTVECVLPSGLNTYLNSRYEGRKNLLLLVIDLSRIVYRADKKSAPGFVFVEQGINVDAILDRIRIDSNEDGKFDISVSDRDRKRE